MALSDDVRKLNKDINDLKKQLGRTDFVNIKDLKSAQDIFKSLKSDVREINSDLAYITDSFKQSVNELSKQNIFLSQAKSSLKSISNISQKLLDIKSGEVEADEKQIRLLQQQAKIKYNLINQAIQSGTLSKDETKELEDQLKTQKDFLKGSNEVLRIQQKINKDKGVKLFGGLDEISQAIPGLSKFTSGFQDASKAAKEQARENEIIKEGLEKQNLANTKKYQTQLKQRKLDLESLKSGKGLNKEAIKRLGLEKQLVSKSGEGIHHAAAAAKANKIGAADMVKDLKAPAKVTAKMTSPLKAGFKALGPMIKKAFGPMALLAELVQALIEGDKAAGDLAKSMNMTYNDSVRLRGEFSQMAVDSNTIFVNTKGLQETYMAINKTLGTNAKISEDVLVQFTELREASGLTNEELTGIFKITQGTNKELNQVTGEVLAQAKISSANLGVTINEKEVLRDINKLSAATTLSLGKNPAILAKTVTTAKALGMSMEQIASSSEALLNFEQSIASELKAELLLGKNINLERARLAALNNDIATVAEEISSQIGSAAEFSEMNVLQQKALAESVGMSRDSLAETLFVQEQLRNVTGDEAKERKAVLDSLIREKGVAEAQRQLAKEGIEGLKSQASIQDRFNKMMEKLREVFVQIAEPILQIISPIVDVLAPILSLVSKLMQPVLLALRAVGNILGPLLDFTSDDYGGGVSKGFEAAGQNMKEGGALAVLGPFGGAAYAMGAMDDGISTHGRRTLITPKGAFALNNNDTVIAGTNLFKGNDVISSPEGSLSVGADNKLLKELLEETKRANNTRREIGNKTVGALDEQGRRQIYSS